eukprot:1901728-Pyramimonas_sp.AAC.1
MVGPPNVEEGSPSSAPPSSSAAPATEADPIQFYEDLKGQAMELFAVTDPDTKVELRDQAARQAAKDGLLAETARRARAGTLPMSW